MDMIIGFANASKVVKDRGWQVKERGWHNN